MPVRSPNWNRAIAAVHDFTSLMSRNIRLATHRTSFRPDPLTWFALQKIAERGDVTLHELCAAIDEVKPRAVSLIAAIRAAVLRYYVDATTKVDHRNDRTTRQS
jgi:predicted DNA-binding ribbon-helix-helix protein